MRHSDTVAVLLRELGQQLAALRREAGLTQENLAALMTFSRSTVSVAEIGRQPQSRQFWAACDKALGSGSVLAAGCDQIDAVREAEERAAACAAQEARQARALAAFTAAQHRGGAAAGVTAVQSCPQCGCQVAVLTTLIRQPPVPAAAGNTNDAVSRPGGQDGRDRMPGRPALTLPGWCAAVPAAPSATAAGTLREEHHDRPSPRPADHAR